jgi:hypothetical protein
MARVTCDISMSLDGFIAGPNQTLEQPLGEGGEGLHEWAYGLGSFSRASRHGQRRGGRRRRGREGIAGRAGRGRNGQADVQRRSMPVGGRPLMRTAGGETTLRSAFP